MPMNVTSLWSWVGPAESSQGKVWLLLSTSIQPLKPKPQTLYSLQVDYKMPSLVWGVCRFNCSPNEVLPIFCTAVRQAS